MSIRGDAVGSNRVEGAGDLRDYIITMRTKCCVVPGAFYNLNALKFYLSCEPVDADLVHEVVKPLGGLELELAEHVGGEGALLAQAGGGGETDTEGEQEPGDHGD